MKLDSEIRHLEAKLSHRLRSSSLKGLEVAAGQRQEGRRATQIAQGVAWSFEWKMRRLHDREARFLKERLRA
jgi:hypothetical protein